MIRAMRKEEMKIDNTELNLNELEEAAGGKGGSKRELHPTKYCDVHQIVEGENLTRIAKKYGTTVNALLKANPTITDKNDITAGYWIYVPRT